MTFMQIIRPAGVAAAVALLGLVGLSITSRRVHADSGETDSRVQIGFNISPVKLNLTGLNPGLVGKGSYIVNAQGDCAGCHHTPALTDTKIGGDVWAPGAAIVPAPTPPLPATSEHNPFWRSPFFLPPDEINPNDYLGGGNPFPGTPGAGPGGVGPLIIYSRNLTPGCPLTVSPCTNPLPEGGTTFEEFLSIFRTGHDFDNAHPACPSLGVEGCIDTTKSPDDPSLLQIMPWPIFGKMSDGDLRAVYEYLSAIPCISHAGTSLPDNIKQTCP